MDLEIIQRRPENDSQFPPLLFLHGAWHGAWCWEKYFMDYFAEQGFENYAFSLRGHGGSPRNKSMNLLSIADYVADLRGVVEKIGRTPIIVAHSMGALVLQKYLEKYPCEAAVLMAPCPPTGVFRITNKLAFSKTYALSSMLTANLYGIVNSNTKAKWAFFSDDLPENELTEFTQKLGRESYRAFIDMLFPNVKLNHHTKVPMLVLGAEKDNIFTVKECELTAKKYSAELIVVKNIAHDMMLDSRYREAADEIVAWLKRKIS